MNEFPLPLHPNILGEQNTPKREQFDKISLNIISYLELFPEITKIDFSVSNNKSWNEVIAWEKKNFPYKIPFDMKEYYSIFNGLKFSWKIDLSGKLTTIGDISLLPINEISRIPMEGQFHSLNRPEPDIKNSASFVFDILENIPSYRLVLMYRQPNNQVSAQASTRVITKDGLKISREIKGYDNPEIWLQDSSLKWYFIADSFTQYLRLAVSHLGIIGWQNAFTTSGLSPGTQLWMRIFCKERLLMDLNNKINP